MTALRWHRTSTRDGIVWWAERGGSEVANVVMTGRPGVDDYPWDWYILFRVRPDDRGKGRTSGVTATLRDAKTAVAQALA